MPPLQRYEEVSLEIGWCTSNRRMNRKSNRIKYKSKGGSVVDADAPLTNFIDFMKKSNIHVRGVY